jgi:hypothetical protein
MADPHPTASRIIGFIKFDQLEELRQIKFDQLLQIKFDWSMAIETHIQPRINGFINDLHENGLLHGSGYRTTEQVLPTAMIRYMVVVLVR